MKSQVQVLAGPPLFSQLRVLPPPGRSHPLPAWAASGPRALRADAPKASWSRPPSAQVMVGLVPASMSLTTCAQPCRRWANLAAYPAPYRGAVPAQPAPPGRPGGRAWPLAEDLPATTAKPTPPLAQHGLRQLGGLGSDSGQTISRSWIPGGATTPTPAVLAMWLLAARARLTNSSGSDTAEAGTPG
jgi:hypothetical protein